MNAINDREFDDYLAGDSALSRTYRGIASARIAPQVDAAILAAAKHANEVRRKSDSSAYARRVVPPALAACTVFALASLLDFGLQRSVSMQRAHRGSPSLSVELAFDMQPLASSRTSTDESAMLARRSASRSLALAVAGSPVLSSPYDLRLGIAGVAARTVAPRPPLANTDELDAGSDRSNSLEVGRSGREDRAPFETIFVLAPILPPARMQLGVAGAGARESTGMIEDIDPSIRTG